MSKLIQSLVENNFDHLKSEAQRIFQASSDQMRLSRQGFAQNYRITVQQITEGIAARVTDELDKVNLLDHSVYRQVEIAIQSWNLVTDEEHFSKYRLVRQALETLLPPAQTKQKLQFRCSEYRDYLKRKIESQLASDHPVEYQQYSSDRTVIVTSHNQSRRCVVKANNMDYFLAHEEKNLLSGDQFKKLVRKYESITTLQNTLTTSKPATMQLSDFKQAFPQTGSVIEKSRDNAGAIFLKAVLTLVTFGVAALLGIWGVNGQKTAKTLATDLDTTLPTPRPTYKL